MKTSKHPKYTFLKRGTYYFSRAVPRDLRELYTTRRIVKSLRTKSPTNAEKASLRLAHKLDDLWFNYRLTQLEATASIQIPSPKPQTLMLRISEGLEQYLQIKGTDRPKTFEVGTRRNIGYLTSCIGEKAIHEYTTADAVCLRNYLNSRELSASSLNRIFGSIKAVFNFLIIENGLDCKNPFSGIYIPPAPPTIRRPVTLSELRQIQKKCREVDDDVRWLLAIISDTGMRLAEAVGLHTADIRLDGETPFLQVRPHAHRPLKTPSSERRIPLVGSSLWAAHQIISNQSDLCFPRYTTSSNCNSNSASATINKWLKSTLNENIVIHGLRHSFRDRLRNVGAPSDLIDQLGGWSSKSIGQNYGEGYSLPVLATWMSKICNPPRN